MRVQLLFPPNWTACVSGPHLALPLLAGSVAPLADVSIQDLSRDYYTGFRPAWPESPNICEWMDSYYFTWEDQVRASSHPHRFTLLSGYSVDEAEWLAALRGETVQTPYSAFLVGVIRELSREPPDIVGITIASGRQLLPAFELLQLLRDALPHAILVVGGNVVTRLRETPTLLCLRALADCVCLYQGEAAFRRVIELAGSCTRAEIKSRFPLLTGDTTEWPSPRFSGLNLQGYPGLAAIPVVSARGCYYGRCSFCAIPAGWSPTGYAGAVDEEMFAKQLESLVSETGIRRFKFVDEALSPSRAQRIAHALIDRGIDIEWEAYARLEIAWLKSGVLTTLARSGLRKLYFGLEQVPTPSRKKFLKQDVADPVRFLIQCQDSGVKVHFFCMVGHPGTTRADALATTAFLLRHSSQIDTSDLVAFRLDRGTKVLGVRARDAAPWDLAVPYDPIDGFSMTMSEVSELEHECQERLWSEAPHLLHPVFRLMSSWVPISSIRYSPPPYGPDSLSSRSQTTVTPHTGHFGRVT